jgi:hypothetical protein
MDQLPTGTLVLRKKNSRKSDVDNACRDLTEQDDDTASRVVYMNKVFSKDIYEVARAALKHDKETFIVGPTRKQADLKAHESLLESHLMPQSSGTIPRNVKTQ